MLAKRRDGFHQVRMLMAPVGLCDRLDFKVRRDSKISLRCSHPALSAGPQNLVMRAAQRMLDFGGRGHGVDIYLHKKIPLAAGLAGGSSDAAATLLGLNRLWGLGLSFAQLQKMGASLGSDIPFCLASKVAIATGRGEKLQNSALGRRYQVVLANPGFNVSTHWAYSKVKIQKKSSINYSKRALKALKDKKQENIRYYCINHLKTATEARYKEIPRLISSMLQNKAIASNMSGSGPTVWGIFSSAPKAEKALKNIRKFCPWAVAIPMLSSIPKFRKTPLK